MRLFHAKFSLYPTARFYSGEAGYFMYPLPLFYLLLSLFRLPHPFWSFVLLMLLLTGALVYVFVRAVKAAGLTSSMLHLFVGTTVLLSYPIAFEYQRCNVEIVLFAFTAFGMVAWWCKRPMLAAFFFGVAGACKIYPLVLVGLLFSERRWRAVVFAFVTTVACVLASAWAFGPTVHDALAWDGFQLALFQKHYAGIPSQLGYDHSFFGLIKFVTLPWHPNLEWLVPVYVRIAAIGAVVLYFLRIWKLPRLNQAVILTLLSVTLPPVSYDYTLLAVYAPFVLLSAETVRRARLGLAPFPYAVRYFVLFGIMLTPLSFLTWHSDPHGAQMRCLCIIFMIWTALRHPIEEVAAPLAIPEDQGVGLAYSS